MAIAGSWRAGLTGPSDYAGALRWGTGINPVHALPDTHKPTGSRLPLGSTADSGSPPEEILGAIQWGYSYEDAALYHGEDYRYLADDHPNWGENETGRADRDGRIMDPGVLPQLEGWPSWGPYNDDNPVDGFPMPGPPGGAEVRAYSDGSEVENDRAIAVPTRGVSGGWLNKAHGPVNEARTSDPSQYEIATSLAQLHRSLDNGRATGRGTDDPRIPIDTRLTGVKVKSYGKSSGMGGGPGTPDMAPVGLDTIPRRPWFFRSAGTAPPEDHTWNEVTYFEPIARSLPPDAGELVTVQEAAPADNYGYSGGDYFA